MKILMVALASLISTGAFFNRNGQPLTPSNPADSLLVIPLGGNTWARNASSNVDKVTNEGIANWTEKEVYFDTYLRISKPGTIKLKLKARTDAQSQLQVIIKNDKKQCTITSKDFRLYDVGAYSINDTGYIKIQIKGISKKGNLFADITDFEITGTALTDNTAYVKNNEGNFFYWGRRGPSVHLNYPFPDSIKAEWFYNEVTVPKGQDVIGSYFMADGFGEGYFGMQVNSDMERRILFSVWSPFSTDHPDSIPENMRITLLNKGDQVHAGVFGDEGSGGQSYLQYNWKAGNTYKFLLRGQPGSGNSTTYTAWFFAPEKGNWMLIASFKRPNTNTYLKRFHSFLENFIPQQGDKERRVYFGNQWIGTADGQWIELNKAVFTYDNTAAHHYRMDYSGGAEGDHFFLKNCGFFNNNTPYKSIFTRTPQNKKPDINVIKK